MAEGGGEEVDLDLPDDEQQDYGSRMKRQLVQRLFARKRRGSSGVTPLEGSLVDPPPSTPPPPSLPPSTPPPPSLPPAQPLPVPVESSTAASSTPGETRLTKMAKRVK